ncbi:GNAT family N-acetyltransferase [Burkholderia sp. SCN-KJ]|uniref:GNAT family N-acetyltransferase n=1 Tax=Burkholderia sp. SCN-KJ TaxID=2969248 RepID=UPI00214FE7DD|nr:GNAT family N-acetyltransferase [Burkholderia sp. SCN-KJ]MCR4470004.1 GNAT family N-acetyltransferase [Burkholderia sp. SCN-KJ]
MSISRNTIAERSPAAPPAMRADRVIVRRFDPAVDSYTQLTALLHRAFARLGAMGLNCTCVDQAEEVTRRRAEAGECHVAVSGSRVVGTMTLYATDPASPCSLYRRDGVASVRQVAVDPGWQGGGIGATLLAFAGQWAALRGYSLLALDTPHPASHLLAFYRAQGFDVVDIVRFAGKRYDSAILCRRPAACVARRMSPASRRGVRPVVMAQSWAFRAIAAIRADWRARRGTRSPAMGAAGAASCRSSPWRPRPRGRVAARTVGTVGTARTVRAAPA